VHDSRDSHDQKRHETVEYDAYTCIPIVCEYREERKDSKNNLAWLGSGARAMDSCSTNLRVQTTSRVLNLMVSVIPETQIEAWLEVKTDFRVDLLPNKRPGVVGAEGEGGGPTGLKVALLS
jgi:hypothetical protein